MRKRVFAALLTLVLLPATACSPGADVEIELENVSESLGVNAAGGTMATRADSRGSFHGDGTAFVEIHYPDDRVLSEIEQNAYWKKLPLSESVEALAYGVTYEENGVSTSVGPYLTERGEPLFPRVQNGYYYFYDRHDQVVDPSDASQALNRASLNVTLAIYNADSRELYYCEFDT